MEAFDVGKLFLITLQGELSIFHQVKAPPPKQERKQKSIAELIETFSRCPADEDLILEDCVVSIASGSQEEIKAWTRLAAMLGATVTEQIIASFTTHVISQQLTPLLKQQLQDIQARAIDAFNK